MDGKLEEFREQLAALIVSTAGDLHIQMQQLEKRMDERFDRIEARLDRQGGIIRAGSIWVDRMTRWSEAMDGVRSKMDERLRKLENGAPPANEPSPPPNKE